MRRALVTFAVGEHEQLLDLSLPAFTEYADLHGYELLTPTLECDRPPSWWKVPMLRRALEDYDQVLWLDCDVAITARGMQDDVAASPSPNAWQALVEHVTPDGTVPNLGVWLLRRQMVPVLEQMWRASKYISHPWWEQAAMLDLLGYQHEQRPCRPGAATELYARTAWLDRSWNSHEQDDRDPDPRFAHVTPNTVAWRAPIMRSYLEAVA